MKRKDTENLREVARLLFLNAGLKQKEIAARISVSEVTVSRWAKAGAWDTLKKNLLTSKHRRIAELYAELEEFNRMISEKEGYKVASSREADARRKLITDIRELEGSYSISNITTMAIEFCEFVKRTDENLAGTVMELFNGFISEQIEKAKWQE